MLNWTLFVVFGMFVFNHADGQYPGARLILTSKALDYVSSLIAPLLEKELSELKIADVSNDTKIMFIGTIHYAFTNIHLDAPFIKSSAVSSSTNGITLQLSNIALSSKCNWEYEMENWPYFGDYGRVEIKERNAAIKLSFLVTKSANGHPVIQTTKCNVVLPSLSVDLHGSSWLNWIYGLFQSKIEETLKSKLCDYVNDTTKEWNVTISSYPLSKEINDFTIAYGLLRDPVFSSSQIQFDLQGEVLTTASDDSLSQSVVHVLPAVENTDNMIHLLLTDKLFATAVMDAINCGLLNYNITPDKLPSHSPMKLNTEFFKHTMPKLFKQFPNLAVTIGIEINKHKELYLDLAGVHVSLLGNLLLQVIRQDGTTLDAFSIELEVHCTMEADILQPNNKPAVLLEATDLQVTLGKLTSSSFGEFETAALKRALNGISLPLMFIINEYGKKGFTIPNMDTVSFVHPLVTLRKDYMQVSADFEYLFNKKSIQIPT